MSMVLEALKVLIELKLSPAEGLLSLEMTMMQAREIPLCVQIRMGLVIEANTHLSDGGEVCTNCWLGLSVVFCNQHAGVCNQ